MKNKSIYDTIFLPIFVIQYLPEAGFYLKKALALLALVTKNVRQEKNVYYFFLLWDHLIGGLYFSLKKDRKFFNRI